MIQLSTGTFSLQKSGCNQLSQDAILMGNRFQPYGIIADVTLVIHPNLHLKLRQHPDHFSLFFSPSKVPLSSSWGVN